MTTRFDDKTNRRIFGFVQSDPTKVKLVGLMRYFGVLGFGFAPLCLLEAYLYRRAAETGDSSPRLNLDPTLANHWAVFGISLAVVGAVLLTAHWVIKARQVDKTD